MTYTVTQLITDAWYLSGVVSQNLETVSGEQLTNGLELLNGALSIKSIKKRRIPYFTVYDFTLTQSEKKYYIPNLIEVETATFFIDTVRYPMTNVSRQQYFATGRADNVESLPYQYHCERTKGGMDFYLYYAPQLGYAAQIVGKFSLTNVALNQDLSIILDQFYLIYLKYDLASYMAESYNVMLQPQVSTRLRILEKEIIDISPLDLSMIKSSTLQRGSGINYAQVNLGVGWTTW